MLPVSNQYLEYIKKEFIKNRCELHLVLEKKVLKNKNEYQLFFDEMKTDEKIINASILKFKK